MSSNTLRSITLALGLTMSGGWTGATALAAATTMSGATVVGKIERAPQTPAAPVGKPQERAPEPAPERASLLKGKLKFVVPNGFTGSPLPPGARMGNADVKSMVYANQAQQQLIITGEWRTPSGVRVRDDDELFLARARADYLAQMQKSLPDYEIIGDKALRIRGLGIRQTEGISAFGNVVTLSTSLLAASGTTQAVVRIISRADDEAGHNALVNAVINAMRAAK